VDSVPLTSGTAEVSPPPDAQDARSTLPAKSAVRNSFVVFLIEYFLDTIVERVFSISQPGEIVKEKEGGAHTVFLRYVPLFLNRISFDD
jgi:hypothetical protein